MNCTSCGFVNDERARFCRGCGAALSAAPTHAAPATTPPLLAPPPLPPVVQQTPVAILPTEPLDVVANPEYRPPARFRVAEAPAVAGLARRQRRNRALLVGCGLLAVAGLGGLTVVVVSSGDDESSGTSRVPTASSPEVVATTEPPVVAPTTGPAAGEPVPSVESAAPVETQPMSTTSSTGAASPSTTLAPLAGDLGLALPISQPMCTGQFVTLIGAAVQESLYVTVMRDLLQQYNGSNYMRTENVCASLRPRMPDGSAIYVAFFGPYQSAAEACAARAFGPVDAYVKVLDNLTDPNTAIDC